MRYRIDRFRGWSIQGPYYAGAGSQRRSIRVGYSVRPAHFKPPTYRYWWRRHPIDTAVADGFGTPLVGVKHYRGIATHFGISLGRYSLNVSLLGRWAPSWYRHWSHARWIAKAERERLAWLESLQLCPDCDTLSVDAGECFECAAMVDLDYYP